MHCRNCGNEVSEKAVGCPKCGLDPRTEKNFCPSCGTATTPNQVVCTNCGVSVVIEKKGFSLNSDTASPTSQVDVNSLVQNPALIAWVVALISFFLPWVKLGSDVAEIHFSFSGSRLASFVDLIAFNPMVRISTILIPFLMYLFPVCVLGIILSYFVQNLAPYTKYFIIGASVLIVYAAIGVFTLSSPSNHEYVNAGFGIYIGVLATLAGAFFSGLFNSFMQK